MVNIFVSIVNYNSNVDVLKCLESLNDSTTDSLKLSAVIVDNSPTQTLNIEDTKFKNIFTTIIRTNDNLGFAGGQNIGINHALEKGADFIVILNPDVILEKNCIVNLYKTFKETDCSVVSPKIYFAKGHEFHKDRYKKNELGKVIWYVGGKIDWNNVIAYHKGVDEVDRGQYEKSQETEFASGCCMMVKKEVFETVGLFDVRYFLYYEDNDLNQRVKKIGGKIYYQPKAFMWHKNAGTTGGSGSMLHDYFITRNRLLFGSKFAPTRAKIALVKEGIRLSVSGRPWQRKGARDFFLGKFGKGSYKVT